MRILFDCRYTRIGRHDGISRYSARLVESLAKLHPVTMLINDERQLELLPDLPWVMGPSPTSASEPFVARTVNRFQPDVVFTPMQTMGPWGRKYGLVTTVHDLIYYTNRTPPQNLPIGVRILWRLYHLSWAFQRSLLNRADAHLTDSQTTFDLMAKHRLTRRPVSVVLLGTDRRELASDRTPPTVRELVYMGSFMPYKNVGALVEGLRSLPGWRLHIVSRIDDAERERLAALAPGADIVFHNGATDEEYLELLTRATALVSASKDEGFGLPLVEAMAVGTPLVVSDIPIFKEIGGDAAEFFPPSDPAAFAAAVERASEPARWTELSKRALERSALFDWDAAASQLLNVLREVHSTRLSKHERALS